jgi:predicted TIM-barrel fold metal-dependent hydrolase
LCWDKDATLLNSAYPTTEFMVDEPMFRAGFRHLAALGLTFEAWAFFPQLSNVASLARAFPDTPIVVNHCGGIVRTQAYARRRDVYQRWRAGIGELASCPNVSIKISGLGMKIGGFAFDVRATAPSSEELADAWRPWIETCVEEFGANRCMYGSNFPVDKGSYNLSTGVNAIKRLIVGASRDEKDAIFHRTAQAFYRLA